jgi:hypothetical protein
MGRRFVAGNNDGIRALFLCCEGMPEGTGGYNDLAAISVYVIAVPVAFPERRINDRHLCFDGNRNVFFRRRE